MVFVFGQISFEMGFISFFRKSGKIHLITFKIHLFLYRTKNLPPWLLDLFPNDFCFKNKDTINSRAVKVSTHVSWGPYIISCIHLFFFIPVVNAPSPNPHFSFPDLCLLSNVFLMINYAHYCQDHLLKA